MKPQISLNSNEVLLFETSANSNYHRLLFIHMCKMIIVPLLFLYFFVFHSIFSSIFSTISPPVSMSVSILLVLLAGAALWAWCGYMVKQHYYILTNQRCIIYAGKWGINKTILSYKNIIDINMNQNFLHTLFKLCSINLTQANLGFATPVPPLILEGLSLQDGEKMTHIISAQIV